MADWFCDFHGHPDRHVGVITAFAITPCFGRRYISAGQLSKPFTRCGFSQGADQHRLLRRGGVAARNDYCLSASDVVEREDHGAIDLSHTDISSVAGACCGSAMDLGLAVNTKLGLINLMHLHKIGIVYSPPWLSSAEWAMPSTHFDERLGRG